MPFMNPQRPKKSKWTALITWFTRDVYGRRGSESSTCSDMSVPACPPKRSSTRSKRRLFYHHQQQQGETSLLDTQDPTMTPPTFFQRVKPRPASMNIDIDEKNEYLEKLYGSAKYEIRCAEDSRGSPYYSGDRITAREAIDEFTMKYVDLLSVVSDSTLRCNLQSKTQPRIAELWEKYDGLAEETH
ncbi:hypothetical protein BDF14DRAFT_1881050 [Spinellus fusiger]|nr:hypothetical protein BDF14DRAFT_1881050 [Spinellus fusiger]